MKLTRPKSEVQRVHVTARDAVTGKSRTITVYDTSPEELVERFGRFLAAGGADPPPQATQSVAAAAG